MTAKSRYLAELLALVVREERPQRLKAGVDTLHPSSLVAVGDFPPDPLLLFHAAAPDRRFCTFGCQPEKSEQRFSDTE